MTLNDFLEAIASKLVSIWQDRHVFFNEPPTDSPGNFFVGIVETSQEKKLDRRRKRHIGFEVLYFLSAKDNITFNQWVETMYDNFASLAVYEKTVGEDKVFRNIRLTNIKAKQGSKPNVYQFLFDADFYFTIAKEDSPTMYNLDQKNLLGGEVI